MHHHPYPWILDPSPSHIRTRQTNLMIYCVRLLVQRKRKAEEQRGHQAKKAKSDGPTFFVSTQVAAKVGQDWILAVVVNANEIKGKIEIEVMIPHLNHMHADNNIHMFMS